MKSPPLLTLAALTATSMNATAAPLGETSRGSISISITIPPHFRVDRVASPASSNGIEALCVGTNSSTSNYHLVVGSPQGTDRVLNLAPAELWSPRKPGTSVQCGSGDVAGYWSAAMQADGRRKPRKEPVLLFIVPD